MRSPVKPVRLDPPVLCHEGVPEAGHGHPSSLEPAFPGRQTLASWRGTVLEQMLKPDHDRREGRCSEASHRMNLMEADVRVPARNCFFS